MINDDGMIKCDACPEEIGDGEAIFIDAPDGGGEVCSWECIIKFAKKKSRKES